MKIEIDTKHDSKEEIRKVIRMLNHLVEDSNAFGSYSDSNISGGSISGSTNSSTSPSYDSIPGLGFMETPLTPDKVEEKKEDGEEGLDFNSFETF